MGGKRKLKNRWAAAVLALLTALSAFYWQPLSVRAEDAAAVESADGAGEETVLLEGIALNKTSLIMKTGDQKTLTASLLPENTTEQPKITWSSDDTDVVQVEEEGESVLVTAPDITPTIV